MTNIASASKFDLLRHYCGQLSTHHYCGQLSTHHYCGQLVHMILVSTLNQGLDKLSDSDVTSLSNN